MGSDTDSQLTPEGAAKLGAALLEVFDFEGELRMDLPLGEIDGWDSMAAVNLTLELETGFGVDLAGIILTGDQTVADVVALLEEKGATV